MAKTPPFNAEGMSLIPGQGIKILHAPRFEKKKKKCSPWNQWYPILQSMEWTWLRNNRSWLYSRGQKRNLGEEQFIESALRPPLVQLLSDVQLLVTPWAAARHNSLSFTISWSLLRLLSIKLVMPSNHLILCHLLLLGLEPRKNVQPRTQLS